MSINPVSILSEALVKEYLKRNGFKKAYEAFNKECPTTELHPGSTTELIKSLRLGKLFVQNKQKPREKRLNTTLDLMTDFFILPELKEMEIEADDVNQQQNIPQPPTVANESTIPKAESKPATTSTTTTSSSSTTATTAATEGFKTPDGKVFATRDEWRKYMFKTFYSYNDRKNEVLTHYNGEIDGQAFDICNIHDCTIQLLDWSATINCDDVFNSTLVIGPVSDSIFIRNVHDSTLYINCRQLRTRDCSNCNIYLYCQTDPIIELSNNMNFAPFLCSYPHLTEQMKKASLDVRDNHWQRVFDFNKEDTTLPEPHWQVMPTQDRKLKEIKLDNDPSPPENPCSTIAITGLDGAPLDDEGGDPNMKSYSIKVSQADAEMLAGDNI